MEISPSYIELKQKIDEKEEKNYSVYDKPAEHIINNRIIKYRPVLTYKAIDDYLLTSRLYNKNYLDEVVINEDQLDEYHAEMINKNNNLTLSNPELLLDNNSEYNIIGRKKGYSLAIRPKNSSHID